MNSEGTEEPDDKSSTPNNGPNPHIQHSLPSSLPSPFVSPTTGSNIIQSVPGPSPFVSPNNGPKTLIQHSLPSSFVFPTTESDINQSVPGPSPFVSPNNGPKTLIQHSLPSPFVSPTTETDINQSVPGPSPSVSPNNRPKTHIQHSLPSPFVSPTTETDINQSVTGPSLVVAPRSLTTPTRSTTQTAPPAAGFNFPVEHGFNGTQVQGSSNLNPYSSEISLSSNNWSAFQAQSATSSLNLSNDFWFPNAEVNPSISTFSEGTLLFFLFHYRKFIKLFRYKPFSRGKFFGRPLRTARSFSGPLQQLYFA
jgi:hypothetical protein